MPLRLFILLVLASTPMGSCLRSSSGESGDPVENTSLDEEDMTALFESFCAITTTAHSAFPLVAGPKFETECLVFDPEQPNVDESGSFAFKSFLINCTLDDESPLAGRIDGEFEFDGAFQPSRGLYFQFVNECVDFITNLPNKVNDAGEGALINSATGFYSVLQDNQPLEILVEDVRTTTLVIVNQETQASSALLALGARYEFISPRGYLYDADVTLHLFRGADDEGEGGGDDGNSGGEDPPLTEDDFDGRAEIHLSLCVRTDKDCEMEFGIFTQTVEFLFDRSAFARFEIRPSRRRGRIDLATNQVIFE